MKLESLKAFPRIAAAGGWELTDEQWKLAEPVPRPARREDHRGRPWHDTRAVLNGVLWILGSGAPWAEMAAKYSPHQTSIGDSSGGLARAWVANLAPLAISVNVGQAR